MDININIKSLFAPKCSNKIKKKKEEKHASKNTEIIHCNKKKCNFHLENQPASLCTVVITKEFGYAIKYNTIFLFTFKCRNK